MASRLAMAQALHGVLKVCIAGLMDGGPGHGSLQVGSGFGFVQPALVVWNDGGGANDPDSGFALFHQDMPAGVLLAQRNIGTVMNQKPAATAAIETFQPVLSPRGSGGWIQRQRCADRIV